MIGSPERDIAPVYNTNATSTDTKCLEKTRDFSIARWDTDDGRVVDLKEKSEDSKHKVKRSLDKPTVTDLVVTFAGLSHVDPRFLGTTAKRSASEAS